MTEGERVKIIRDSRDMTMEEFGKSLGITKAAVSNIEKAKRNVTDQMRILICKTYNINKTWLLTGEGKMSTDFPENDEIASLVYNLLGPDKTSFQHLIIEIMRTYRKLTPASQQVIDGYISDLVKNLKTEKGD